jgi:hypothetical protein
VTIKQTLTMLLGALLVACSSPIPPSSALPAPDFACQQSLDWRGIVPGESTRRDVVRILGKPARKGRERYVDGRVSFYAYRVEDGAMAGLAEDRVFFGRDGVVAWIEVSVADRDGQIHTIDEITEQLGTTLDQVYVNNDYRLPNQYDAHAGPDNIYVWAECGLAVGAGLLERVDQPSTTSLVIRHPVPAEDLFTPTPRMEDMVFFKFFFPPTSWTGFEEFYKDKVPFYVHYIWSEYRERIKQ